MKTPCILIQISTCLAPARTNPVTSKSNCRRAQLSSQDVNSDNQFPSAHEITSGTMPTNPLPASAAVISQPSQIQPCNSRQYHPLQACEGEPTIQRHHRKAIPVSTPSALEGEKPSDIGIFQQVKLKPEDFELMTEQGGQRNINNNSIKSYLAVSSHY